MIVTINTDASFSNRHKRGTFAFWINSNRFVIQKTGILRKKCSRPEIAEFRCIINAIHTLGKQNTIGLKKIIINTDCLNVIHLIKKDKEAIRKYQLQSFGSMLVFRFEEVLRSHKLHKAILDLRHVRSHTGADDARSYVNEWCDTEAKKQMDILVNQLEGNETN